ncbi:MAG: hydantoinase/oxoprolinase family protein, partial [Burkholderia sp.]|nr:hydantoinase/oxoprolinase family protein [Burkholderia sp.]
MRIAVDTGGTFTDLIVEYDDGQLRMAKAPTTPGKPLEGVHAALQVAAQDGGFTVEQLLARTSMFIYGTTHALNAVVTGRTARTAFLTTEGHPDILVLREGGRPDVFDYSLSTPAPYIPRSLTWQVSERMLADGSVSRPLDEAKLLASIEEMKAARIEAVAVCLLWSNVNHRHEERIGELLAAHLPSVPVSLSHRVSPTIREYRRASATAIDASLKPSMIKHLEGLRHFLREAGLKGRLLVLTSRGGILDIADAAAMPIQMLNSGPAMAPISGRYFASVDEPSEFAIVADTGGTTYDVSLVRRGRIPVTRETHIESPSGSHITGFPS